MTRQIFDALLKIILTWKKFFFIDDENDDFVFDVSNDASFFENFFDRIFDLWQGRSFSFEFQGVVGSSNLYNNQISCKDLKIKLGF